MSEDFPKVTISMDSYKTLCRDSKVLAALEASGVDNWEGYDIAMQMLRDDKE